VAFHWAEYLALAKELSQKGGDAAARSAISRAYYAAYNTARRHRGARRAVATRGGSHSAVWTALTESGNNNWRTAGNKGRDLLERRRKADYDDEIAALDSPDAREPQSSGGYPWAPGFLTGLLPELHRPRKTHGRVLAQLGQHGLGDGFVRGDQGDRLEWLARFERGLPAAE